MREHRNLMPHLPKARAFGHRRPMRDGLAQRHGSWWTIENGGIAAGERDQLIPDDAPARKVSRSGFENMRERSGQRMEGAALIVQTERAVMVVGIGSRCGRLDKRMPMGSDRRRFIHIERVVAEQGDDPRHLRDYEECRQAGPQTAYRSFERHGLGNRSGRILGETGAPSCGKHATVRNYLVRRIRPHRAGRAERTSGKHPSAADGRQAMCGVRQRLRAREAAAVLVSHAAAAYHR